MRRRTTSEVPLPAPRVTTLNKLAERIREADKMAIATLANGLEHARYCGELLLHAKRLVPHGEWGTWLKENTRMAARTARAYMALARLSEPEWRKKKGMTLRAALWGAGDLHPEDEPRTKPEDPDPTNGPDWTDPQRPDAELHEVQRGIAEEAEHPEREEWNTMREAKRWLEAAMRQAYRLVGRKGIESIVQELLDELDRGGSEVH